MDEPSTTVDVRDMVCAQALATVGRAVEQLHPGGTLSIHYNAADVHQDLRAWARQIGHELREAGPDTLRLTRGPLTR